MVSHPSDKYMLSPKTIERMARQQTWHDVFTTSDGWVAILTIALIILFNIASC